MKGDGGDHQAGAQITNGEKPPLRPAYPAPRVDAALRRPVDAQHKGQALQNVGPQEVADEDEELVRGVPPQPLDKEPDAPGRLLVGDVGRLVAGLHLGTQVLRWYVGTAILESGL